MSASAPVADGTVRGTGTGTPQIWTVARISAGFFMLFMAFNSVGSLVSTLVSDNRLVQASSSLLYACFTITAIFAPKIIERFGAPWCMFLGSIPYVLLVFANLNPSWALFMPAYFGVGVGAALLWASQGIAMSRAAVLEAARTGEDVETINNRFSGLFWSTFQFNGALGLIIASSIFVAVGTIDDSVKTPLFLGFGVIGSVGVLILAPFLSCGAGKSGSGSTAAVAGGDASQHRLLDDNSKAGAAGSTSSGSGSGSAEGGSTSFVETARFVVRSRQMQLLIPIIFYCGASLGFFQTMFPLSYADKDDGGEHVTRFLSPKFVGYVAATFYLTNSGCSYLWGRIVPRVGRRPLFITTLLTHLAFFSAVLFLVVDPSKAAFTHGSAGAFAAVFALAIVFATGDSVLESQLPALVQSPAFLPSERDRACAVANLRLWQSLGFTVQFAIGVVSPGNVVLQAAVLLPMLAIAMVALFVLDRCVQPLSDHSSKGYAAVGGAELPPTAAVGHKEV